MMRNLGARSIPLCVSLPLIHEHVVWCAEAKECQGGHTIMLTLAHPVAGQRVRNRRGNSTLSAVPAEPSVPEHLTDEEILAAVREWASDEGIFAAPEGAASLVAYKKLVASGFLKPSDRTVLFNTGSGIKYIDVIAPAKQPPKSRNIGGIIGPF